MKRAVYLYGRLKEEFGERFDFDIEFAAEAFRALNCAFPGKFISVMREGAYEIIRGDRENGFHLSLTTLSNFRMGDCDLHVVPVAEGSGQTSKAGTALAILGVAVVGAAIFFSGGTLAAPLAGLSGELFAGSAGWGLTFGTLATLGLGAALYGASMMLSRAPLPTSSQDQSSIMGPVNVSGEGQAIPLIYGGPIIVGSQIVSAGMDIEDIEIYRTY